MRNKSRKRSTASNVSFAPASGGVAQNRRMGADRPPSTTGPRVRPSSRCCSNEPLRPSTQQGWHGACVGLSALRVRRSVLSALLTVSGVVLGPVEDPMHYALLMVSWLMVTGVAWAQVPVTARPQEMVFSQTEVELADAKRFAELTGSLRQYGELDTDTGTTPGCWLSSSGWRSLPVRWRPRRQVWLGRCTRQRIRTLMEYQWREESCSLACRSFVVCG